MRAKRRRREKRGGRGRWLAVLAIIIAAWFTGCNLLGPARPPKQVAPPLETGRIEDARELVRSFMEARLSGMDEEELAAYMTTDARNDYRGRSGMPLAGSSGAPLLGYRLGTGSSVATGEFGFPVSVQSSDVTRPLATNVREDLLIKISNGAYQVISARFLGRTEASVQGSSVVWDNNALKKALFSLADLPNDFSPIGSNGARFGVGKEGFSTLAIRPDDGEIAFGTWGVHGLLGVADTAQKRLDLIDLYFEGQAKLLVYSPNGRYLSVEEATPVGSSQIRIYLPRERRLLDLGWSTAFPPDRYQMNISRWETDSKTIFIRINRFSPSAEETKLGVWAVNVETGDREKLIM